MHGEERRGATEVDQYTPPVRERCRETTTQSNRRRYRCIVYFYCSHSADWSTGFSFGFFFFRFGPIARPCFAVAETAIVFTAASSLVGDLFRSGLEGRYVYGMSIQGRGVPDMRDVSLSIPIVRLIPAGLVAVSWQPWALFINTYAHQLHPVHTLTFQLMPPNAPRDQRRLGSPEAGSYHRGGMPGSRSSFC